jgi:DNA polymerase III delta prime subunit
MFENIIGHTATVQMLRDELTHDRFPRASLFFGPPYAGKLSSALEAARVLTCREGRAEWTCSCSSCRLQKELAHPHTVLLGMRYADVEIAASAGVLMRSRTPPTQYLFLRAVRKLTRRFDAALLDTDDARMKGALDRVSLIEDLLMDLQPGGALPPERELGERVEKVVAAALQLAGQLRTDGITVGQVRRLAVWAHMTATESRKVAIIENADRMQDSARNALLKLLEEPPEAVSIFLLCTRRAAIIPTILSRLRPYPFEQRSQAEERDVMAKIFREETPAFESLRGYFLAWKEINPEKLSILAGKFLDCVWSPDTPFFDISEELSRMTPERKLKRERSPKETIMSLLEELSIRFLELLRSGRVGVDTLEEWNAAMREAQFRLDIYNMGPQTVLESLLYRMRRAARQEASV